jgi:hypothetical protein
MMWAGMEHRNLNIVFFAFFQILLDVHISLTLELLSVHIQKFI